MLSRTNNLVAKIKRALKRRIDEKKRASELVLNYNERSLSNKALSHRCLINNNCNFVELYGDIKSADEGDCAFLAIDFYDELARPTSCKQPFHGLKSNDRYACYSYLSKDKFKLLVKIPDNASSMSFRISSRKNKEAVLLPGTSLFQFSLNFADDVSNTIATFDSLDSNSNINQKSIDNTLSQYKDKHLRVLLSFLYDHYKDLNYKIAYHIGFNKLQITKSLGLAQELKTLLNFNGEMRELAKFIDTVNTMEIPGWKMSSRRINDDIDKMDNGFSFDETGERKYPKSNVAFYLLHNSLPYNSGGYATRTHGLLKCLNNSGYDVHGVSRPGFPSDHKKYISKDLPDVIPEKDTIDNVDYLRCDQKTRKSSLTISEYVDAYSDQLIKLSDTHKPSIIHAASNHPNGLAAVKAAKKLGIKSVYEVRGLWEITRLSRQDGWDNTEQYEFMAKMEAEACIHADRVLTITHALKDIMIERGVDKDKISVVPNCVNVSDFTPFKEKNATLMNELSIKDSDVVIGYIGSIVNYEGLDDLIKALHLLKSQNVNNFKMLIVGDGAYLSHIVDLVNTFKLQDRVIFTGRVPHEQVDDYYSLVDITPFPRKPFLVCEAVSPLKPFEAMASGKAVLVSSCAALTEIVSDGYNGVVFEKGNVDSFANKLRELIEDPALRQKLSRNGYEWVVKNRDWTYSAGIIDNVYQELLAEQ